MDDPGGVDDTFTCKFVTTAAAGITSPHPWQPKSCSENPAARPASGVGNRRLQLGGLRIIIQALLEDMELGDQGWAGVDAGIWSRAMTG